MKKVRSYITLGMTFMVILSACQKMERPALGDYPSDTPVTPTTALRFYVPFDSTSPEDAQLKFRFRDSISGNPCFPPNNSITSSNGISGKCFNNVDGTFLRYLNTNDFVNSTSMSIAFWMKHDGVPANDAQFVFSIPSTAGHWSNATMFLILDHTGAGATKEMAVLKLMIADSKGEKWFELVKNDAGDTRMPNIYDNNWHHLAFAYDEATSNMTIYRDGILFQTINWNGHGALSIEANKVDGFRLGGKTTDWGKSYIGSLDQLRLYNKALTTAEVQELFNNKK